MDRVTEYTIIRADTVQDLVRLVQDTLEEGWEPLGGPFLTRAFTDSHGLPAQAMVKYGNTALPKYRN